MLSKKQIVIVCLVAVGVLWWWTTTRFQFYTHRVEVRGQELRVRVADNPREQMRGLSGVRHMAQNEGMYFSFPDRRQREFWMQGMLFPLDVVWIADGRVVDLTRNVPPPLADIIPRMRTEHPVDGVLELRTGSITRLGIAVGDDISLR